jgi:hypothetical protein
MPAGELDGNCVKTIESAVGEFLGKELDSRTGTLPRNTRDIRFGRHLSQEDP